MRWLRGVAALVALGLVLLGSPFALTAWGRGPAGWEALARPEDGTVLLFALTVVGWLAWAAFSLSSIAEAARLLSKGRVRLRIPLLGGLQQLSAGLLIAVLALAPNPLEPSPPATTTLVQEAVVAAPEPAAAGTVPEAAEASAGQSYLVAPGDDLWTVSEYLLGDGGRWRELAAANPVQLGDPTRPLTPGSRLALPAASASEPLRVRVRRGDTLSGIALEHLGAAGRWPRIAAANDDLIEDPDHIEIGWQLLVPGAVQPPVGQSQESERAESEGKAATQDEQAAPDPGPPDLGFESPDQDPAPAAPEAPPTTIAPLLGTLGTLAAAAIVGAFEARRFLRLRERPVGRRLIPPDEPATRLRAAMRGWQRPDGLGALDAALRSIGQHCFQTGAPLPELERIEIDESAIAFHWATDAGAPPDGFAAGPGHWSIPNHRVSAVGGDHPCPYPAVVSLGSTAAGGLILVDAERSRVLGVAADDAELGSSALASMGVELGCAPWAAETRLVVYGDGAELIRLAGADRVSEQTRLEDVVAQVHLLAAHRRDALAGEPLAVLRVDPDRADAVAPVVFLLLAAVPAPVAAELDALLAGPALGIAIVLATDAGAPGQWTVTGDRLAPVGLLSGEPVPLRAHAIPEATRAGVAALFRAADDPATTKAPWWSGEDANLRTLPHRALPHRVGRGDEPVDVVRLVAAADHPKVLLIGPAELRGASGPEPARSRQQLVELCAWLLEHPGRTPTAMASGLAVAEGTRRSNLSRLRNWLGEDPDGQGYLPDAYSGRIALHSAVTSDWHQVQLLLAPGLDRLGDAALRTALELVRGAPLADAAPGQWHWAEELRIDIASALRDTGVVLVERALARGDIDLARWAAARALVVAPEDEQLLCARIRTEHRAGNRSEVERLVNQVTRQARILGVDLLPETVEVCQQVIEGRLRARQA
ncbi:MAG: LysM peptidoglycan-binding domain-containing protein [Propionicimonas sp.]